MQLSIKKYYLHSYPVGPYSQNKLDIVECHILKQMNPTGVIGVHDEFHTFEHAELQGAPA